MKIPSHAGFTRVRGAGGGEKEIEARLSMLENTVREQKAIIERQERDILDLKKSHWGNKHEQ